MRRFYISLFLVALLAAGCSPRVTSTLIKSKASLEPEAEVTVLQADNEQPENAVILETLQLSGDDYDALIEMAKDKSREAGGNVVKIVKHLSPDVCCPRHRVSAIAFWADDSPLPDGANKVSRDFLDEKLNITKGPSGALRIALQGGAGYRVGRGIQNLSTVMKLHEDKMRLGPIYSADISYFFSNNVGAGIRVQGLFSYDILPGSSKDLSGNTVSGNLEDYVNILFFGPVLSYRIPVNKMTNALLFRFGYGFVHYSIWEKVMNGATYKSVSFDPGLMLELGYDFAISRHFAVGASLTYITSRVWGYSITDSKGNTTYIQQDREKAESLGNIGLSIGIRYNL